MLCLACAARAQVTLAWNPPATGTVTNYTVFWGTQSGVYTFVATNGTATNLEVIDLSPGTVYYFTVQATASDGTESPFSNEITYTNPMPANSALNSMMPPSPPGMGTNANGTNSSNLSSQGNTGNTGNTGNASGSTGSNAQSGSSSEFAIQGIPPILSLALTNHHPLLTISGTVGATLQVQSTPNPFNPGSWTTITDLAVTNPAADVQTNQGAPSALTLAYVPAVQNYEVIDSSPPSNEFYRVAMPYDYMVLADAVLSGQGYPSRLLLIRMPGVMGDDLCYVSPQNSFIFYDSTNRAFAMEPSGSTIRKIASTFSDSLGQNWTSASEFAYSNGVSTILATVVEVNNPSSDPVAGASAPSIVIDF